MAARVALLQQRLSLAMEQLSTLSQAVPQQQYSLLYRSYPSCSSHRHTGAQMGMTCSFKLLSQVHHCLLKGP
jgi:hypothetical protein